MNEINESSRKSGSWLPNVEKCENRVKPCGNPFCADEAMRSGGIIAGGGVETNASRHAASHAQKIAKKCKSDCPLEEIGLGDRFEVLDLLKISHSKNNK